MYVSVILYKHKHKQNKSKDTEMLKTGNNRSETLFGGKKNFYSLILQQNI